LLTLCAASAIALVALPNSSYAAPSITDVRKQVAELSDQAEIATEAYNEAKDKLAGAEKQLKITQDQITVQQGHLDAMQAQLGAYTAMAYRNSGMDQTLQLLVSQNPQTFLDRASTLDQITTIQVDELRRMEAARQVLLQSKSTANQEIDEIAQTRAVLQQQRDKVETSLRKAQALLNSLTAAQRAQLNATPKVTATNLPAASGRAKIAVDFAKAQLGEPYVWGGAGPSSWDCSGLTMKAWAAAGVYLPHSAHLQYNYGTHVSSQSQLQPGDLVFYYSTLHHVAIYIGNGLIIHAPRTGENVQIASLNSMPYVGATRLG